MKKTVLLAFVLFWCTAGLFSGESATFVNLGFSPNGRFFMFGQYGYQPKKALAYGEIYTVDVVRNAFVPNGVFKESFPFTPGPGQSSDGALYTVLEKASSVRARYRVSHLLKGRPLYLRIEDEAPLSPLRFRDFETSSLYEIVMKEDRDEEGSAFSLSITVTPSEGRARTYEVGHPSYKRKTIVSYVVQRVFLSPEGEALIIVLSTQSRELNTRYMVETFALRS